MKIGAVPPYIKDLVTVVTPELRQRVSLDKWWMSLGICGDKPELQCQRCKKFPNGYGGALPCTCKQKGPDLKVFTAPDHSNFWFPQRGDDFSSPKKICRQCPVRQACLAFALENGEHYGIWGATTERERRRYRMGRELTVTCRYCAGVSKAGQARRSTCNRIACKSRWADEMAGVERSTVYSSCENCGFKITADEPVRTCNAEGCQKWLADHPDEFTEPLPLMRCSVGHVMMRLRCEENGQPKCMICAQKDPSLCSVPICNRPRYFNHQFCFGHYKRALRHDGDPQADVPFRDVSGRQPPKKGGRPCSVPGCPRPHKKGGYCTTHNKRLERFGDVFADIPIGKGPIKKKVAALREAQQYATS